MNSNYVAEIHVNMYPGRATCIWRHVSVDIYVSGYKLLVRDTGDMCPGVNAAYQAHWQVVTEDNDAKARFPLPELTGGIDGRAFPLAELTARQLG